MAKTTILSPFKKRDEKSAQKCIDKAIPVRQSDVDVNFLTD